MNDTDPQLVQQIADLVMAALASQTAPVRPPAGLCTAGGSDVVAVSDEQHSDQQGGNGSTDSATVLHGIITANQLGDAMKAAGGQPIMLASDARLTPLAQDLARKHADRLGRFNAPTGQTTLRQITGGLPWWWWTCCSCDAVKRVTGERSRALLPSTVHRSAAMIGQAVADLASAIERGKVAGGVLFVSQAAKAMCLANRCRSLRAIHGHCDQAVDQGIDAIGANVLVIEFPYTDYESMARRVDRFTGAWHTIPAQMRRLLGEVER